MVYINLMQCVAKTYAGIKMFSGLRDRKIIFQNFRKFLLPSEVQPSDFYESIAKKFFENRSETLKFEIPKKLPYIAPLGFFCNLQF